MALLYGTPYYRIASGKSGLYSYSSTDYVTISKLRDELGFRMKQQAVDKDILISSENGSKTIHEEETEGARYEIDGPLRRVTPYYFTYLTYCKLRWRDRKLIDVFVDEFRDKEPEFYRRAIAAGQVLLNKTPTTLDSIVRNGDLISHRCHRQFWKEGNIKP